MDGVPDLTQKAVPPGGAFTYQFVVGTAGTFWYHSHVNEMTQVRSGLYGPFIVEPRNADNRFDPEQTLVLADFGSSGVASQPSSGSSPAGSMGGMDGMMGGSSGMMGNPQQPSAAASAFIINGKTSGAAPELTVRQGERIRLRLINASASADYYMRLDGHQLTPVATDGHDLPQAAAPADLIRLSPAEQAQQETVIEQRSAPAFRSTRLLS
jgi:FtsP/CotA-like multicopper oxidase with cupredoxin domain